MQLFIMARSHGSERLWWALQGSGQEMSFPHLSCMKPLGKELGRARKQLCQASHIPHLSLIGTKEKKGILRLLGRQASPK